MWWKHRLRKNLQLTCFLPPTPVRLLMDVKGNNLASQVEFESFNRQLNAVNRHTGSKFVNAVQNEVHQVLRLSEDVVAGQARELITAAKAMADQHLTLEHDRLLALKSVNLNIRDEFDAIEEERQQILSHLDDANWRPDAIRLIVVSHQ